MTTYTADTSVVVPALASWHESHVAARTALAEVTTLPAHVVLEVVAVLTRLPHGLAVPASTVVEILGESFPGQPWVLGAEQHSELFTAVGHSGLRGGQIYDALVGATAKDAGATLLSRDRHAAPVYAAVGAAVEPVAS